MTGYKFWIASRMLVGKGKVGEFLPKGLFGEPLAFYYQSVVCLGYSQANRVKIEEILNPSIN